MHRLFTVVAFVLMAAMARAAEPTRPRIYIEPQEGFESYLSAAMVKKNVPVVVTQDKDCACPLG